MESYYQRTVFVESGVNRIGDGIDASWTNNDGTLSVQGNDKFLKMTLQTLSLHRNFYTINYTNNRFYLFRLNVFTPVVIPDGEYPTFILLAAAIQAAITVADPILTAAVTYDDVSRKFVIDMTPTGGPWLATDAFYFFCDPSNNPGTIINPADTGPYGIFNDSYLLFGAKPNRNIKNALSVVDLVKGLEGFPAQPKVYYSFYPALLGTMDEIVLRCQTPGVNLSSYGYDVSTGLGEGNNASLVPSNILARIPIRETIYIPATAYIQYIGDGDETFNMLLGVKSLNNLRLVLTDARGRPLPQTNVDQAKDGVLSFRASLRIDYLQSVLPQTSRVLQPQDLILQQKINLGQE